MKYQNADGQLAEVLTRTANANNQIRIQIDGEESQKIVDYDWFVRTFKHIAKDQNNTINPDR